MYMLKINLVDRIGSSGRTVHRTQSKLERPMRYSCGYEPFEGGGKAETGHRKIRSVVHETSNCVSEAWKCVSLLQNSFDIFHRLRINGAPE